MITLRSHLEMTCIVTSYCRGNFLELRVTNRSEKEVEGWEKRKEAHQKWQVCVSSAQASLEEPLQAVCSLTQGPVRATRALRTYAQEEVMLPLAGMLLTSGCTCTTFKALLSAAAKIRIICNAHQSAIRKSSFRASSFYSC